MLAASSSAQSYQPAQHTQPPPPFLSGGGREAVAQADLGIMVERDRPAAWSLAEHRCLTAALAAIAWQICKNLH